VNSVLIVLARIPQPSAIVASCPEPWTMRSAGAPVKGAVMGRASWLLAVAQVSAPGCGPCRAGRDLPSPIPASITGLPLGGDVAEWLKAAVC
jgi:hypothetical protein